MYHRMCRWTVEFVVYLLYGKYISRSLGLNDAFSPQSTTHLTAHLLSELFDIICMMLFWTTFVYITEQPTS